MSFLKFPSLVASYTSWTSTRASFQQSRSSKRVIFIYCVWFVYFPDPAITSCHRGEPKPREQRGDLAVRERLPRTLRVLAMTLERQRPASYRWIRVFTCFPRKRDRIALISFVSTAQGKGLTVKKFQTLPSLKPLALRLSPVSSARLIVLLLPFALCPSPFAGFISVIDRSSLTLCLSPFAFRRFHPRG